MTQDMPSGEGPPEVCQAEAGAGASPNHPPSDIALRVGDYFQYFRDRFPGCDAAGLAKLVEVTFEIQTSGDPDWPFRYETFPTSWYIDSEGRMPVKQCEP